VVVVVDASAIVQMLIRGRGASLVEEFIAERVTFAPTLLDVEVLNSIARMERNREMSSALASEAAENLAGAKIVRIPSDRLTSAAWALRHNIAIADAFYVALAVLLRATLLTTDAHLARAPKLPVPVTLLPT
jgi:predicted nucleic acid-binding protein